MNVNQNKMTASTEKKKKRKKTILTMRSSIEALFLKLCEVAGDPFVAIAPRFTLTG